MKYYFLRVSFNRNKINKIHPSYVLCLFIKDGRRVRCVNRYRSVGRRKQPHGPDFMMTLPDPLPFQSHPIPWFINHTPRSPHPSIRTLFISISVILHWWIKNSDISHSMWMDTRITPAMSVYLSIHLSLSHTHIHTYFPGISLSRFALAYECARALRSREFRVFIISDFHRFVDWYFQSSPFVISDIISVCSWSDWKPLWSLYSQFY